MERFCEPKHVILEQLLVAELNDDDHRHDENRCWYTVKGIRDMYCELKPDLTDGHFTGLLWLLWDLKRGEGFEVYDEITLPDGETDWTFKQPICELFYAMYHDRPEQFATDMERIVDERADGIEEYLEFRGMWNEAGLPADSMPECITDQQLYKE